MARNDKPLTAEQKARKAKADRERRERLKSDPDWVARERSRRLTVNLTPEQHERRNQQKREWDRMRRVEQDTADGISREMRDANNAFQAAKRFDQKHGTDTRHQLPEETMRLFREYKRLKMESYRRRNGVEPSSSRLIRDDGYIDWIAVEIAARGDRLVNMTQPERVMAVAVMERRGVSQREMERRLGLSDWTVWYLRESAKRVTDEQLSECLAAA